MRIGNVIYHRPQALQEACELGRTYGHEGRYLAGGTELIIDLAQKRDEARYLISLRDISELRNIDWRGDHLCIGAMVTLTEVATSPLVLDSFPALAEAVLTMGSEQVRNQASIGGNFCRAVPCADSPPICITHGARLRLVGAEEERIVPAESFFVGPRRTLLVPGELLVEIQLPAPLKGSGASYQRFSLRRGSALAVASVAARIGLAGDRIQAASVVLGAVAPVPLPVRQCEKLLVDQEPSDTLFERAGRIAAEEAKPITDIRGSEAYRRELVAVLTVRALQTATARARQGRA